MTDNRKLLSTILIIVFVGCCFYWFRQVGPGDIGSPDVTLGFSFTHNMDNNLSLKGGIIFIKGFIWYIEDTDFRIFDSENGAMHNWIAIRYRPTSYLSVYMKCAFTNSFQNTTITEAQAESGYWINNPMVNDNKTDYRIQVNYAF